MPIKPTDKPIKSATETKPLQPDTPPNSLNPPPNPLYGQFADARALIGHVASGSLIVAGMGGPPGLGKTHLAEQVLVERGFKLWDDADEPSPKSFIVFSGSVAALIQIAYRMRDGGVIVLDDADGLFLEGGRDGINTMKQLLLGKPVRTVTNFTKEALENQERDDALAPTRFQTQVRFVVCTNDNFGDVSARMRPHIEALQSRGLQMVRLSLNPRHHLDYTLDLIADHDLFLSPQATREGRRTSLAGAQEIADWLRERGYHLNPGPSPRAALDAANGWRLERKLWRGLLAPDIRATPLLPTSEIPPRRVLLPRSQRPGYVAPVANLHTAKRQRQREAAQAPDHQQKQETEALLRQMTLLV